MDCSAVCETIVKWLKDYLSGSGQNGFVVGVSGGIDSALVSTLCAMTGKPTMLLTMPIHQAEDQVKRGNDHRDWLKRHFSSNISSENVDLTKAFETLRSFLNAPVQNDELSMANMRARLRMTTLYAYAGHFKYLVAGTGNAIEDFGIGFFTKWGDGSADVSPIGDLSKSQVRELSGHVGIIECIRKAKPTDGLWSDNRSDEDHIGASYAELEWAMAVCETEGLALKRPLLPGERFGFTKNYTKRQGEVLSIYKQRHAQSRHKLEPIPICKIPKELL